MGHQCDEQSSDFAAFVAAKHVTFGTPAEVLHRAIVDALGVAPISRRRLTMGEMNEVYEVRTGDGQEVIVRISHRGGTGFVSERWALETCGRAGLPVPEVLSIAPIHVAGSELTVCIERRLPGAPLQALIARDRTDPRIERLITAAGVVLGGMHTLRVAGFGNPDGSGVAPFASWPAFLAGWSIDVQRIGDAVTRVGVARSVVDTACQVVRREVAALTLSEARLIHTDFAPKHILVEGDRITGVIDLESCLGGDPAWDFAAWEFWFGSYLPTAWLQRGYPHRELFSGDFAERCRVYRLLIGLDAVRQYAGEENPPGLELTTRALVREVDALPASWLEGTGAL